MTQKKKHLADPFDTLGSSRVFYQLVLGQDPMTHDIFATPSAIAESLGITPASVIEHLHRFQHIGVVSLGGKEGRLQFYKINWKKFVDCLIERVPTLNLLEFYFTLSADEKRELEEEEGIKEEDARRDHKRLKMVLERLRENRYFRKVVKLYFEYVAAAIELGHFKPVTLNKAVEAFEEEIYEIGDYKKERGTIKDEEMREFLSLLRKWSECTVYEEAGPRSMFRRAMESITGMSR